MKLIHAAMKREIPPFKAIQAVVSILAFILMAFFALPVVSYAVDCSMTSSTHGHTTRHIITWTSDGTGAYACTTTIPILGKIVQYMTKPSGGASAPDPAYDVGVTGASTGVDLDVSSNLDNRSQTATEAVLPSLSGIWVFEKISISVAAAGATNSGTLYVDVEKP